MNTSFLPTEEAVLLDSEAGLNEELKRLIAMDNEASSVTLFGRKKQADHKPVIPVAESSCLYIDHK